MYNPMSVKCILNAKGTAFIRLHLNAFYKGTALFDTTGTVFNICLYLLFDGKDMQRTHPATQI